MKRAGSLDGLRGLAVLMVVFFHYSSGRAFGPVGLLASFGWVGVDIFLVLSGFLITTILFEQRGSAHFFRNFYIRRALRLFPLYYFILFLLVILTPVFAIHWRPEHASLFLYSSNYFLASNMNLGTLGPFNMFHTWTLALEEQFYLVWPWLVGNLTLDRKRLFQICVGGILLAPVFRIAFLALHLPPWEITVSLPCRMDALLLGAALALIPRPSIRTARLVGCGSFIGLSIVLLLARSLTPLTYPMQTAGYTCIAFLCGSVLVLCLHPHTTLHKYMTLRFLRFYGRYSYGIYLWHYLFRQWFYDVSAWILKEVHHPSLAAVLDFLFVLLVSTAVAVLSYTFLESPFLRLKRRYEMQGPARRLIQAP